MLVERYLKHGRAWSTAFSSFSWHSPTGFPWDSWVTAELSQASCRWLSSRLPSLPVFRGTTHPRIGGGRGRGRPHRRPLLVPSETDCIPAEGIDRRWSRRICPPPTKADDMVRYGASQTALFWAALVLIVTSLLPPGSAYFLPDSRVSYDGLPAWFAI